MELHSVETSKLTFHYSGRSVNLLTSCILISAPLSNSRVTVVVWPLLHAHHRRLVPSCKKEVHTLFYIVDLLNNDRTEASVQEIPHHRS